MQIKFSTQGPADFVNNYYVLAFNTSGAGTEPYAINGNQTQNWLNFSYELVIYQANTSSAVQASLWQFVSTQSTNGGTIKTPVRVNVINPQDLFVIPNCGSANQFCVTLNRTIFVTAFTSPTPSPSPSASPGPPNGIANTWFINWFIASPAGSPSGQVISAAGTFGITDTTFNKLYDITTSFDQTWSQPLPPAVPAAPSQASQITGGEVLNVP